MIDKNIIKEPDFLRPIVDFIAQELEIPIEYVLNQKFKVSAVSHLSDNHTIENSECVFAAYNPMGIHNFDNNVFLIYRHEGKLEVCTTEMFMELMNKTFNSEKYNHYLDLMEQLPFIHPEDRFTVKQLHDKFAEQLNQQKNKKIAYKYLFMFI